MPTLNGKKRPDDSSEHAVLGCLLKYPDAVPEVIRLLTEEDFRTDAGRRIFRCVVDLWDQNKPTELTAVADALHERGWLEDVGGAARLAELFEMAAVSANVAHYAQKVRNRAILRGLAHAGREIAAKAEAPTGPAEEMLTEAEQRILALSSMGAASEARRMGELVNEAFSQIDARMQRGKIAAGLPTGFTDLDDLIAGLQNGELTVIAARPGAGKTAMAVGLASHATVEEKTPTLFISLEQSQLELVERLLCLHGQVNGHFLRRGALNNDELRRLADAGEVLRQAPLFIDDQSGQRMLRIAATARRLKVREKVGLVIVDYLQLVEPDNPKAPRQEQVAAISRRLKTLARELSIPIVALAQLNRALEGRVDRRPRLSDLRESGAIEADADAVWLLHKGEQAGTIEVIVAKHRTGPVGEIVLNFDPRFMRFSDPAISGVTP